MIDRIHSELPDTQKITSRLLSETTSNLPPDVIAMCVQASAKIFGAWAAGLASNWDDDDLPELKNKVASILTALRRLAADANFEVQERVRVQFFELIRASKC